MRALVTLCLICLGVQAAASQDSAEFNTFIGSYKVVGSPKVTKKTGRWCRLFHFEALTGFKVTADTGGSKFYHRSHMLSFVTSQGTFTYPIQSYSEESGFGDVTHVYVSTTGNANFAMNTYNGYNNKQSHLLQVFIGRPDGKINLRIDEQRTGDELFPEDYINNGFPTESCTYEASLKKI